MRELPLRLVRNGRPEVPNFDENETLYRRFDPIQMVNEKFPGVSFDVPNCSVNRGGLCPYPHGAEQIANPVFSHPEDVIIDHPTYGVISLGVNVIPESVVGGSSNGFPGKKYVFRVEHTPLDDNYSHCDIRVYVDDQMTNEHLSKHAKKEFRTFLRRKFDIVIQPTKA